MSTLYWPRVRAVLLGGAGCAVLLEHCRSDSVPHAPIVLRALIRAGDGMGWAEAWAVLPTMPVRLPSPSPAWAST